MKNRKRVIVAFVMVAALCLGIGYAALNDSLYATGNLAVNKGDAQNEFKNDVFFTGVYEVADKAGQPIDVGVTKRFLQLERHRAYEGKVTPDCRHGCAGCGASQLLREVECDA